MLRADRNLGFAAGNNLALADLGAVEYVALLNNDAFVERDWLRPLVSALEAGTDVGAATSKVLFAPRLSRATAWKGRSPCAGGGESLRLRASAPARHAVPRGWLDPDYDPAARASLSSQRTDGDSLDPREPAATRRAPLR